MHHTHTFLDTKLQAQPICVMYNHLCLSVHLLKLYNCAFTYVATQIIKETAFCVVAFIEMYNIYFVHVIHVFGSFVPQICTNVNIT